MNSFRKAILSGKGLHSTDPIVHDKQAQGVGTDNLSSVGISRSESRSHDHRDDDRHRLDQEKAIARFDGEEHEIDLVNLSGGGAMIRANFTPRLWERVDLVLGEDGEIECAVRWLRDDRIGLEFAHETRIDCAPEERDALLLDVIRRSFPDVALTRRDEPAPHAPAADSDEDDAIENSRRVERRHPLIWTGEILFNHSSEKVRLRNISEHGALVESPTVFPTGVDVFLDLQQAGQHFATVSWTCGDKIGLKFQIPFDLGLLGQARPELAPELMTRPGPAGRISSDGDNPWAEGWGRQSLEELRDNLEGYLKR